MARGPDCVVTIDNVTHYKKMKNYLAHGRMPLRGSRAQQRLSKARRNQVRSSRLIWCVARSKLPWARGLSCQSLLPGAWTAQQDLVAVLVRKTIVIVMNIERSSGPLVHSRSIHLNLFLRATLQSSIHSQHLSHTTNEKNGVNKSFSVKWPLNS